MIIAIDGPVASGKSTVARRLAHELGFYYLYTGLLYRGIAYVLVKKFGYEPYFQTLRQAQGERSGGRGVRGDMQQLSPVTLSLSKGLNEQSTAPPPVTLSLSKGLNEQSTAPRLVHPRHADIDAIMQPGRFLYRYVDGSPHVIFDGEDLTPHLKQGEVDDWSSISSADPYVRHAIFEMQVALGREHDLVAEGRDIGTVVFPHADHKFFLTASLSQRATWWRKMQEKLGRNYSSEESLHEVAERDRRDMSREHSPLTKAPDAIEIDGSDMTIDQLVAQMRRRIEGD